MVEASELPGAEVLLFLSCSVPSNALLVGRAPDDGLSDQLVPIVGLDRERNAIVVEGGRRIPMGRLRTGSFGTERVGLRSALGLGGRRWI
jgi:hypothetical protein